MTVKESMALIGTNAIIAVEKSLRIEVTILDVRENFGRTEYQVRPLAGAGEQWVNADRVCTDF